MKTLRLIAKRDDSTGELGLVIEGASGYDVNAAGEGLLIAHDIVEHPSLDGLGRIDDELEALGAIWMCRGRHGELNRTGAGSAHTIEENIASDITRMGADLLHGGGYYSDIPRRSRPHDHDSAFKEIIAIARRAIPAEYGEPTSAEQDAQLERYLDGALHLMRAGARKLARRFPGQFRAHSMFWAIAEAVEPYARNVEYEGAEYALRYGMRGGEAIATCDEIYEE